GVQHLVRIIMTRGVQVQHGLLAAALGRITRLPARGQRQGREGRYEGGFQLEDHGALRNCEASPYRCCEPISTNRPALRLCVPPPPVSSRGCVTLPDSRGA